MLPGDIKIIDLARPFHSFNTDFDNITLTVPRQLLAPWLDRPDSLHGMVLPRDHPIAQVLGSHIRQLASAADRLSFDMGAALAEGTVRLLAACLGASRQAREETRLYRAAAAGQAVRDFVDRHIAEPDLGPERLTETFRLSRAGIYRMFEAEGGVSAYILARRLRLSWLVITDPDRKQSRVGDIAFAHGFSSDAYFSRVFRRTFGVTPSEARSGALLPGAPRSASFINDWMRGLRAGTPAPGTTAGVGRT